MKPSVAALVLLAALLIRIGILLVTPGALDADPDGYRRLAVNMVEYRTFGDGEAPTAFRPPLYPLLLAIDNSRIAIGVLHVVLGVATVGLVLLLGRRLGLNAYGSALAALLVAFDPILLSQSTQVMTETLAAFLAAASLAMLAWAGQRPTGYRAALAGIVLGLGALCRPTLLPWAVAVGIVLLLQSRIVQSHTIQHKPNSRELATPGKIFATLRLPVAFAFGAILVLSPWAIRNQLEFGRPVATTTHGGYTLLLANNPEFYDWLRSGQWGTVWHADAFNTAWDQRKPSNEIEADRLAYSEAWQNIAHEPGMFCCACLTRIGRFWSPLPHQITADESSWRQASRYAVAAWYLVEFLLAAIGISWFWGNLRPSVPHSSFFVLHCILLVVCLTTIHTLFWTDMRMRAPIMPVVALAAAAGVLRACREVPSPSGRWRG